MTFDLKQSIPLGSVQAYRDYRLRKISQCQFWCMLTARYGHYAHRVKDEEPSIEGTHPLTDNVTPFNQLPL